MFVLDEENATTLVACRYSASPFENYNLRSINENETVLSYTKIIREDLLGHF